jgi:hypothetical protein
MTVWNALNQRGVHPVASGGDGLTDYPGWIDCPASWIMQWSFRWWLADWLWFWRHLNTLFQLHKLWNGDMITKDALRVTFFLLLFRMPKRSFQCLLNFSVTSYSCFSWRGYTALKDTGNMRWGGDLGHVLRWSLNFSKRIQIMNIISVTKINYSSSPRQQGNICQVTEDAVSITEVTQCWWWVSTSNEAVMA